MSRSTVQQNKAASFLALHHADTLFVLPNAWDVVSAKIFINEGFSAIGTTSAGIAASLGYADGQQMSFEENLEVVARIARSTDLPVSADFESGYGSDIEGVAARALELLDAGAIGLNIEDSEGAHDGTLIDTALHGEKIRAIRRTTEKAGKHLFINARTDAYLVGNAPDRSLREAIERGNAYVAAGADCVFIPDMGDLDGKDIKVLAAEIDAPVNVIAGATTPCLAELQELGVSRVSLGPRPMRVVLSVLREIASEIRSQGTFARMSGESISYDEMNAWFAS